MNTSKVVVDTLLCKSANLKFNFNLNIVNYLFP